MYFGEKDGKADSTTTPMLWLTGVACGLIVAAAWIPGINMFGLDPVVVNATASFTD